MSTMPIGADASIFTLRLSVSGGGTDSGVVPNSRARISGGYDAGVRSAPATPGTVVRDGERGAAGAPERAGEPPGREPLRVRRPDRRRDRRRRAHHPDAPARA